MEKEFKVNLKAPKKDHLLLVAIKNNKFVKTELPPDYTEESAKTMAEELIYQLNK